MAEIETLGILEEIQALVSDKLQVVSYKWLSRNFLVSSNVAKRLLQEFVKKHGGGLEVAYTLSGWLKNNPSTYHIRLVSKAKLSEAKQEFDSNCSVQVYSVQACLPKDPATLWNTEFIQAEELFKQPLAVDNCLRDNRFCGVSNSFVKRNAGATHASATALQLKSSGIVGRSRNTSLPQSPSLSQPQQKKVQESSPNVSLLSPNAVKDVQSGSHNAGIRKQNSKPAEDKEKVPQLPVNKKKGPNDKNSYGTAGGLASMWGRASAKPKGECASATTNSALSNSGDAQICSHEEVESDDDGHGVNIKRGSNGEANRKRRVIFDYSDEEDEYKDAVNLESPDPPKKQVMLGPKQSSHLSDLEKNKLRFEEEAEDEQKVEGGKGAERKKNQTSREETSALSKGINTKTCSSENNVNQISAVDTSGNNKVADTAPKSPKRRKVLKTRIDERGREVTEVVWEGEEAETKPDYKTTKNVDSTTTNNAVNRSSVVKKSPAVGSSALQNHVGKAGNKKAVNKDPKQGNILSFFKKV